MKYILALDQGTTSSRAAVFDKGGNIIGVAQREFKQIYPQGGWVEHDPQDILGSQTAVIAEALVRAGISGKDLAAIGITNQRETTLVWDKATGKPVYNAIVWQCRRTAEFCEELKKTHAQEIRKKTGLIPDAYFSATKLKWILDNVEGARARAQKGELLFGTVDTFLMWHLSGGKIFATDYTNASRTMLFNIHILQWDKDLLKLFDVPEAMLPQVRPSGALFGHTNPNAAGLGAKVPICGVAGDQQAALFGQLCWQKGCVKNTYGTGCFLLMNTGEEAVEAEGLVTTLAAGLDKKPQYALEGSVFIGGAVVQWLRDELRLIANAQETEKYAVSVADTAGVYVVPAFVGLGAPYWDPDARGIVCGITRGTKKEHFIRAALESIAYQVNDVLGVMQKAAGGRVMSFNVDGGASANDFLMQFQADISNVEVVRPRVVESTALGACYLAGLAAGYWKNADEIRQNNRAEKTFCPAMSEEKRKTLLDGWSQSVRRALKK